MVAVLGERRGATTLGRMRIFLVRHAQAAPGDPDELRPLTPEGQAAARALAERLAAEQPTAVVSSPLLRARQTADEIARAAPGSRPRSTNGSRPARRR